MLVCDSFLQDPQLLRELRNVKIWKNVSDYNWWDGWWSEPPNNPLELVIQKIWQGQIDETGVAGFEYWFNDLSAGKTLEWHRDCDEALRGREGRHVTPHVGHIYYVIVKDIVGGYLEVSDKTSLIEAKNSELERLKPVENRLVIFNPSFWHRVTPLTQGHRLAFLANLWVKKPNTFALGNHVDGKFQPVTLK